MFGECHAHALMNGVNYQGSSRICTKKKSTNSAVRECLERISRSRSFVCKGWRRSIWSGECWQPNWLRKYGIDYRTPVFAIHKNGHYGSIVGRGFADIKEFHQTSERSKRGWCRFYQDYDDRSS